MRVLYYRTVATATTAQLRVEIPAGSTVRRVEVHVITIPLVALGTPDAASCFVRLCSMLENDTADSSTWLFGQENVIAYQPLVWQGKQKIGDQFNAYVYLDVESCTVGNQIELAVTIDS